jgi:hypothetical protein
MKIISIEFLKMLTINNREVLEKAEIGKRYKVNGMFKIVKAIYEKADFMFCIEFTDFSQLWVNRPELIYKEDE